MKKISGVDKNEKFTNCELFQDQNEGRLISVNKKFLAMNWKKEGQIVITDSSKPIKINPSDQTFKANNSKILDLEFSPFNNNLLASSHENKSVLLWKIPDNDLKNIGKEITIYDKHEYKVSFLNFNPISSDVICSCTFNGYIHIWNIEKSENFIELKTDNNPTMMSWNPNGYLIGSTTKKIFNIFDCRTKERISKININESSYSSKYVWNNDNLFTTISLNKNNEKMLKLWDMKKIGEEINSIKLDSSSKKITPFIDRELQLIYTIGHEEKFIEIYDYSKEAFKKLTRFESSDASTCSILFDRNCLEKNKLEVDRFARYSRANKNIYYINFYLKSQDEEDYLYLYPKIKENTKMTYEEWIKGNKNDNIKLKKREDINKENDNKNEDLKQNDKVMIEQENQNQDIEKMIKEHNENLKKIQKEFELKVDILENKYKSEKQNIISEKEKKILDLENKIKEFEKNIIHEKNKIEFENKYKKIDIQNNELNEKYNELEKLKENGEQKNLELKNKLKEIKN